MFFHNPKWLAPALLALPLFCASAASAQQRPEIPITLEISKTKLSEADGAQAARVRIKRVPGVTPRGLRIGVKLVPQAAIPGHEPLRNDVLQAPTQVLLPADQNGVEFFLSTRENLFYESETRQFDLEINVAGFLLTKRLTVENATPGVGVSITPDRLREGGPNPTGTVTLSRATPFPVRVTLGSSDARVRLPASVYVPPGTTKVNFPVQIIDDGVITPPNRFNTISFSSNIGGIPFGIVNLFIEDNVTQYRVDVSPRVFSENAGPKAARGTIHLLRPNFTATTFVLQLSPPLNLEEPTKASVPKSVTVPAGETEISFDIGAIDNSEADGDKFALLYVRAPNQSGLTTPIRLEVLDDESEGAASAVRVLRGQRVDNRGIVRLQFSGSLRNRRNSADNFTLRIGGKEIPVRSASLDASGTIVDLLVGQTLPATEAIEVAFNALFDSESLPVAAANFTLPATSVSA